MTREQAERALVKLGIIKPFDGTEVIVWEDRIVLRDAYTRKVLRVLTTKEVES